MPGRVSDARRGGIHARRDWSRAGDQRGDLQITAFTGARQATRGAGGLCRRLDTMTDDSYDNDRIDERVRKLAADHYHPPQGSVPRDAMWANIAAARLAERAARANDAIVPMHSSRRHLVHWRWAVALAAGLLVGVALDRAIVGGEHTASPLPVAQRRIVTPATPESTSAATSVVAPTQ